MKSIVLNVTARFLLPWLLLLSLVTLYRGHNLPGGGFIGGLAAASAYILYVLGPGVAAARRVLRVSPKTLMGVGLLLAILSGVGSVFAGNAYMQGLWLPGFSLPLLGNVHIGTPLLFDIGVYLVVVGFTLLTTFTLTETREDKGINNDSIEQS